ncbi:TetR/AcrR family transcriptional regulator [Leifsonia sp. P73]|uniref:TetR/AcrR family transcriptional regulator n=1 Tax=Leifsonia sp. P73 TaxID=3423959 RepID=UPI003DA53719
MARPRNQEARRREIVEATALTLVDRGYAKTRLRDIAEAAGVTPASVLYYYPEITDLFAETYAIAAAEYVAHRRERMLAESDPFGRLRAGIESGVPVPGTESAAATVLLVELEPMASRHPVVAREHGAFLEAQEDLYAQALEEGEAADVFRLALGVRDTARTLVAMEDGLALDVLTGRADHDKTVALIVAVARTLTGGRQQ